MVKYLVSIGILLFTLLLLGLQANAHRIKSVAPAVGSIKAVSTNAQRAASQPPRLTYLQKQALSEAQTHYLESEMNHISNEDLLKLDTWIANNVPNKNFERLFTIWVHLTAEYSRLIQQRDAALKLADEILIHRVSPLLRDSEWVMGRMDGKRDVANKIRAIFEPKEGK